MKLDAAAKQTKELLSQFASHLWGKEEFKGEVYQIQISANMTVAATPIAYVYPNRHQKKSPDKDLLLHHIAIYHMPETLVISGDAVIARPDSLVPGTYAYIYSFFRKRRKWMKM